MFNHKGFTLFEVLISFSLLMTMVVTLIPLLIMVDSERKVLSERRFYASQLHDELQIALMQPTPPPDILTEEWIITFQMEVDYLKGCVQWENFKKDPDEICFYGLPR